MNFTLSDFPAKGNELTSEQIVDLARLGEEVGFDRFGVTDFPFHYDCISLMTACLRATRTIEIESLVTTPYARLADASACAWATMAALSGGRAIFGIGGGVEAPSKVWVPPWGNTRPKPVQAVREVVAVCRQMWAGEVPIVEGEIIRSSGLPLGFPLSHRVPVLIAARGPRMLRLAGEIADIVHIASPFLGIEYQRDTMHLIEEGARRGGRSLGDFEIDVTVSLCVSRDRDKARRLAKMTTGAAILWMAGADEYARKRTNWSTPAEFDVPADVVEALATRWDMWSGEPLPPELESLITDPILDQFTVAGEPDECVERLRALSASLPWATGIRCKLPPLVGSESVHDFREIVTAAGAVVSALRDTSPHGRDLRP